MKFINYMIQQVHNINLTIYYFQNQSRIIVTGPMKITHPFHLQSVLQTIQTTIVVTTFALGILRMLYKNRIQSFHPLPIYYLHPRRTPRFLQFPNRRRVVLENEKRRKDVGNVRRRHVADWIDNKRQKLRNLGKEYKSRDGTTRLAKSLKPMCLENCRQKCSSKTSSDERIYIFNQFWNLGNREKQWVFVARC